MTRAQRVLTISAISATLYFLALFAILPVPFVSDETAEKVLPVVRSRLFEITFTLILTRLIHISCPGGCLFPSARMPCGPSVGMS